MAPLRIAVLEADTPAPAVLDKYGTYGTIFANLLRLGAQSLAPKSPELQVSAYDVVNKTTYPTDTDIDAVLITGSRHDSFASDEWTLNLVAYTRRLLTTQSRIRVLGVCYGHQIVARALGASVGRSSRGWELAVVDVDLSQVGRTLFGREKLAIHQMHQDTVHAYPEGITPLGTTALCDTQGMYQPGRLMTVQGHPEFNHEITQVLLDSRVELGKFSREVYDDATARCKNPHDGVLIAAAFLRFLVE